MWRVKNWAEYFEKSQSKRCPRVVSWVPIPNKQDGDGYTELLDHPNGAAHFGAWTALVQLASKCRPRGTLLRDETCGHDIQSLTRITRIPQTVYKEVIPRLMKIGWLEEVSLASLGEHSESATTTGQDRTGQDITRQEGMSADADDPESGNGQLREWLGWWNGLQSDGMVSSRVNEERPSEAVRMAWKRSQRSREIRELLAQRLALEDRIRKSVFCREGWFRLEKLLGAKNRDHELIVRKLLDGGYQDSRGSHSKEQSDDKLTEARAKLRKEFAP